MLNFVPLNKFINFLAKALRNPFFDFVKKKDEPLPFQKEMGSSLVISFVDWSREASFAKTPLSFQERDKPITEGAG